MQISMSDPFSFPKSQNTGSLSANSGIELGGRAGLYRFGLGVNSE